MPQEKFYFQDERQKPKVMVQDAINQFAIIGSMLGPLYDTIEKIRAGIIEYPIKYLEDFKDKPTEVFEKELPGICKKYNDIVEMLHKPDLTMEEVEHCKKEIEEIKETVYKE